MVTRKMKTSNAFNDTGEGQFLTFKLYDEIYAVRIEMVREVMDYSHITRVPKAPPFMKGAINLRGGVVPVVDLRVKFGMPQAAPTVDTCIIIIEVEMDGEDTLLGALADQVREVIQLEANQVEPPPKIGTRLDTEFIMGMAEVENEFIVILDIEKAFALDILIGQKDQ